jgi:alpha-L-fucosidase
MKKAFVFAFLVLIFNQANAQHKYVAPTDTLVLKNLAEWQDRKFGLFMHWGTYSQWGIVESWSLCPEDESWTRRRGPYANNYAEYVQAYENLQTTFNPGQFNPGKWVKAAKDAGMQYVVFTTKHHDGFCMFDSRQTDYKITSSKCPFSTNPKSNVTREIFDAFHNAGFMTGAYFSKPDWNNNNYWWRYFPPKDRNVNYDPKKHPDRWNKFKKFTYDQIEELMSEYGKVDILWLDGGWVRPLSSVDTSIEWQRPIKDDQDIDMKTIAGMARRYQPGLIIVDRTVTGEFENYTTPEQEVPNEPLPYPWETCMTMGNSWSYVPGDHYKSPQQIIHLLVKIVSRGGNFLLNIGPGPEGDWDPVAYARLQAIGDWMKINGEGIYASTPVAPYSSGNFFFTQSKKDKSIYAFYLGTADTVQLQPQMMINNFTPPAKSRISILGTKGSCTWKTQNGNTIITIPSSIAKQPTSKYAVVFKIVQ